MIFQFVGEFTVIKYQLNYNFSKTEHTYTLVTDTVSIEMSVIESTPSYLSSLLFSFFDTLSQYYIIQLQLFVSIFARICPSVFLLSLFHIMIFPIMYYLIETTSSLTTSLPSSFV